MSLPEVPYTGFLTKIQNKQKSTEKQLTTCHYIIVHLVLDICSSLWVQFTISSLTLFALLFRAFSRKKLENSYYVLSCGHFSNIKPTVNMQGCCIRKISRSPKAEKFGVQHAKS